MVIRILVTAPVLALLVFSSPTFALEASVDTNGDGFYSLEELQAFDPTLDDASFAMLDESGDGVLDPDEIKIGVFMGIIPE